MKKSKVKGVYWETPCKKWVVRGSLEGKSRYLGSFDTEEEAITAREAFNIERKRKRKIEGKEYPKGVRKKLIYVVDENGCHICTSHRSHVDSPARPMINVGDKLVKVHRYLWRKKYGVIKEGVRIVSTCKVRDCINIEHYKEKRVSRTGTEGEVEFELDFENCYNDPLHDQVFRLTGVEIKEDIYNAYYFNAVDLADNGFLTRNAVAKVGKRIHKKIAEIVNQSPVEDE